MSKKLLAMGNVLMEDDGIAVYLAAVLEKELEDTEIEVVYGETDIGYSLMQISEGDFIILMDASCLGRAPGTVSLQSVNEINADRTHLYQHSISMLDMIKLYFPENDVLVLTVEIAQAAFHYGLSKQIRDKMSDISKEILSLLPL